MSRRDPLGQSEYAMDPYRREPVIKKHFHDYTDVRWRDIHVTWHSGWLQDAMDKAVKSKVAKAVVPAIGAVYEALR